MIISPPTKAFCYIKMIELNIIETWKMWCLGSARAQEKCNHFFFFNRNSALALVENILTEYLSSFTRCSLQWLPTCTVTSEIIQTIFWIKLAFPVCIVNKLQVTSDEIGQHFVTHHLILPWHQKFWDCFVLFTFFTGLTAFYSLPLDTVQKNYSFHNQYFFF